MIGFPDKIIVLEKFGSYQAIFDGNLLYGRFVQEKVFLREVFQKDFVPREVVDEIVL